MDPAWVLLYERSAEARLLAQEHRCKKLRRDSGKEGSKAIVALSCAGRRVLHLQARIHFYLQKEITRLSVSHAAKAEIVKAGIRRGMIARRHSITRAVVVATEPRSTSNNPVPARVWTLRIVGRAHAIVVFTEPIGAPFPHVPSHIVQAISIRRKRANRRASDETITTGIAIRKGALPPVGSIFVLGSQFVAPGILLLRESSTSGIFELGFRWQSFSRPRGVGFGIIPGNLSHWFHRRGRGRRPFRMSPVGAVDLHPPAGPNIEDS